MQNVTSEIIPTQESNTFLKFADTSLKLSANFWFLIAVVGQMLFISYLVSFYVGGIFRGNLEVLNEVMPHGYIAGDLIGNLAIIIHIFFAIIIIAGGILQIIPQVRNRFPTFHRWNGRVYLTTAFIMAISGIYMVWVRGGVGDFTQHLGITLNAILVITCAVMVFRTAIAGDFVIHRRWALRLFIVVSGVWFFRVGLMFWIFINNGPVGFDPDTFQGPFLSFLSFADSLIPLAVLELYLRSQKSGSAGRFIMAFGLFILTFAMGFGIFAASFGLWFPKM